MISENIDRIKACNFTEYNDKKLDIKNKYSLEGKKISTTLMKEIMVELKNKTPTLSYYIITKLSHAIDNP